MTREIMDIAQVAEYLGLATDTIYQYLAKHKIPAFRPGPRVWRFRKSTIDKWIEEKEKEEAKKACPPS